MYACMHMIQTEGVNLYVYYTAAISMGMLCTKCSDLTGYICKIRGGNVIYFRLF